MKRLFVLSITLVSTLLAARAQNANDQIVKQSRVDNSDNVVMDLIVDLKDVNPKANHAVVITPQISNGQKTVDLGAVGVYGRKRYYYLLRERDGMLSGRSDERILRANEKPDTVHLPVSVPFENWMNGSPVTLQRTDYGCCNCEEDISQSYAGTFFDIDHYLPTLLYRQPVAETEKRANLEGSAIILFELNNARLNTAFANNKAELGKIYAVIDSVKNDPDITLTGIKLKGFASPDGKYEDNRLLAQERTEAIRSYLLNLYRLEPKLISCESEPEDWEGARHFVATTTLPGGEEVLKIIDSVSDPDERDDRIRTEYPYLYQTMYELCYPTLRHTDYRVSYSIRSFSNPEEIERMFGENPQKLSLNELYLLANTYEPGSERYNKVFNTAVLLYPNDSIANLNAANVALSQHDLPTAAQYLYQAGESGEAEYARGVLNVLRKDFTLARTHLSRAKEAGIDEADRVLETIAPF
jgi:hypothetical protein